MAVKARETSVEVEDRSVRFVDRETAKQYLPFSDATLWRMRKTGAIKAVRTGGRVLFDLDSIEEYLAELARAQND